MTATYKYDAFISYRHQEVDKTFARGLLERLEDAGLRVAIDERDFDPAATFLQEMERCIKESRYTLAVMSPRYLDSGNCQEEAIISKVLDMAERRRRIIPLTIEAVEMPLWLYNVVGINFTDPDPIVDPHVKLLAKLKEPLAAASADASGAEPVSLDSASALQAKKPPRRDRSRLPNPADRLFGRKEELGWLDEAWESTETNVVVLRAWGGVGKTALAAEWLEQLREAGWRGAEWVFEWSFYSQGTRSETGANQPVSADPFIAAALTFFKDPDPQAGSAWDRGKRLADLVAQTRGVLVLDGIEPMQHPPGPLKGQISDPSLLTLLKALAQHNPGLCLVTTREPLTDLERFRDRGLLERGLGKLSSQAGAALLHSLGVSRAGVAEIQPDDKELQEAVQDVKGHALTLQLMGRYLALALDGDIRKRDAFHLAEADLEYQTSHDPDSPYGHSFRVIRAYERWWLDETQDRNKHERLACRRQLAALRCLGLFNRPATTDCLEALRQPPAIEGLTEELVGLDDPEWTATAQRLEELGLVQREPKTGPRFSLDAHPLVREYFALRLQKADPSQEPSAWKQAHSRLFDHLCQSTQPHQPDSLVELQPLYQAIVHGCLAGRQQEACDSVYHQRIQRGAEHYAWHQLGAFGSELAAITSFFEKPWNRAFPTLTEPDRAWLLSEAAFILRALGRLTESVEPLRAGLEMAVSQEDWKNASIRAGNLSELELTLGRVSDAVTSAEQAVKHADRSGDGFLRLVMRTTMADAHHQAGQRDDARSLFREAEALQAEQRPANPVLYSLRGFQYCDLLLADTERDAWAATRRLRAASAGARISLLDPTESERAEHVRVCAHVCERAEQTLSWAREYQGPVLTIALDYLTLSRAAVYRWILVEPAALQSPAPEDRRAFDLAVDGLRNANSMDHLPRGFLTRAWYLSLTGENTAARADLDEAWEIAERGSMKLHMADIQLTRARLFDDREALAEARKLIEHCVYNRRLPELEDAEAALG